MKVADGLQNLPGTGMRHVGTLQTVKVAGVLDQITILAAELASPELDEGIDVGELNFTPLARTILVPKAIGGCKGQSRIGRRPLSLWALAWIRYIALTFSVPVVINTD